MKRRTVRDYFWEWDKSVNMSGDNRFELDVLRELSEIKSTASATQASVVALNERLFNGGTGIIPVLQEDIAEIKSDAKEQEKYRMIKNIVQYASAPVLVGLHILIRRLGVNI
jgi:hypothetical protein